MGGPNPGLGDPKGPRVLLQGLPRGSPRKGRLTHCQSLRIFGCHSHGRRVAPAVFSVFAATSCGGPPVDGPTYQTAMADALITVRPRSWLNGYPPTRPVDAMGHPDRWYGYLVEVRQGGAGPFSTVQVPAPLVFSHAASSTTTVRGGVRRCSLRPRASSVHVYLDGHVA